MWDRRFRIVRTAFGFEFRNMYSIFFPSCYVEFSVGTSKSPSFLLVVDSNSTSKNHVFGFYARFRCIFCTIYYPVFETDLLRPVFFLFSCVKYSVRSTTSLTFDWLWILIRVSTIRLLIWFFRCYLMWNWPWERQSCLVLTAFRFQFYCRKPVIRFVHFLFLCI